MSGDDFTNNTPLQRLKADLSSGDFVAFIGSGPSSHIYRSWQNLIIFICTECGITLEERHSEGSLGADALMALAESAKLLDADSYCQALAEEYGQKTVEVPNVYKMLYELPFKSHVTLNFDPLIGKVAQSYAKPIKTFPDLPPTKLEGTTFYVHGRVEENSLPTINDIVLSSQDFTTSYDPTHAVYTFLKSLFVEESVVFIGCTLSEPELQRLFKVVNELTLELKIKSNKQPPQRYILLPNHYKDASRKGEDADTPGKLQRLLDRTGEETDNKEYVGRNIDVVRYDNLDGSHKGLDEILKYLLKTVPRLPTTFEDRGLPR